jgi:hypothetical protein
MMDEKAQEVLGEIMKNAKVLNTMLVARATTEDELIDLLVEGFRQLLDTSKEDGMEPDFTDGPINAYSFYLPVVMLLQDPDVEI